MKKKKTKGPDPEHLKIEDVTWQEAMNKAIKKKKPENGWPESEKEKKEKPQED